MFLATLLSLAYAGPPDAIPLTLHRNTNNGTWLTMITREMAVDLTSEESMQACEEVASEPRAACGTGVGWCMTVTRYVNESGAVQFIMTVDPKKCENPEHPSGVPQWTANLPDGSIKLIPIQRAQEP